MQAEDNTSTNSGEELIRRVQFIACLLAFLAPGAFAASKDGILQQDIFRHGENGIHTYRIPALVQSAHGVLIAVVDARHDSSRDLPNRISLVMRRSFNLGKDWDPMRTLMEVKEGSVGDASLLLDRSNGRVWCFFTYGPPGIGFFSSKGGDHPGPETTRVHAIHSDDDGTSWSPPVDLTEMVWQPGWQGIFATSGTDIQISTGRLLVPLVVRDALGTLHSVNAYSDDHGKTWKSGKFIGVGTDESHNAELPDGSILQNMRNGHYRAIAISHDGGVNFGPVTYDEALIDPGCNASITRYRHGRKDVYVFTNAASSRRENMTVRLSYDDAKSWAASRVIFAGPAAYSTAVPLSDGSVGLLYERGEKLSVEEITFAKFRLRWVTEKPR